MFINITDRDKGNNKGTSGELVHYLDKELRMFKDQKPEDWFNSRSINIPSHEVKSSLDHNIAKLCRDDAKFFLLNISPSQKEIAHLKELYGEARAKEKLKEYVIKVMDEYARNFKHPKIRSHKDLMWFGKLENHRYYTYKDKEVKAGLKKRGMPKPGEQMHIQIIVSRKDISNKIRLSPMNKSRGKNVAHSKKMGQFDRSAFQTSGESLFDRVFGFERQLEDTFRYAKTQKNGSLEERMALHREKLHKQGLKQNQTLKQTPAKRVIKAPEVKPTKTYILSQAPTNFLEIALAKSYGDPVLGLPKKKKRKKGQQVEQQSGQGL